LHAYQDICEVYQIRRNQSLPFRTRILRLHTTTVFMTVLTYLAKKVVEYVGKKNPRKSMNETLIIGLGNPGKKFEWTRHNLGWLALDQLLSAGSGLKPAPTPSWEKHHKVNALITKTMIGDQSVVLMKPQTSMNDSGKAIREYLSYHKGNPDQIIVVHDDIDIDLGKMRIVKSGSSAGHNGVQSIIKQLKTQDFIRLRLGVKNKKLQKIPSDRFVLQPFSFFEKRAVRKWLVDIAEAVECLVKGDVEKCMNRFH